VDLRTETAVRRFRVEGDRCLGVETDAGRVDAGSVVNACGAWAGFDGALPFAVPVEPVRGQIVEIGMGPAAPASILEAGGVYVAPHEGGRVLVGSTLERDGFEKRVTAGTVSRLISEAARLWPAVANGRFGSAWAGLRPGTPDGMPILGGCGIEGLFFATGHYRHGVLLAPATARRLADALTGRAADDLSAFSISRFSPDAEIRSGGPKASVPADFK
jgi:glycine oxidase